MIASLDFKKGIYAVKTKCRVNSVHAMLLKYCNIRYRTVLLKAYTLSIDEAVTILFCIP